MTFRNTTRAWGTLSKTFHWLILLLIILQWLIAERAEDLKGLAKVQALGWHKSFGITILMLAVLRLVWRWMNPVPTLDGQAKGWEKLLAHLSHILLYGLIFAIPLSGWLMSSAHNYSVSWFKLIQLPNLVQPDHELAESLEMLHKKLFVALVVVATLHLLGALKHHVIDRNEVLKRMLPFGGVK